MNCQCARNLCVTQSVFICMKLLGVSGSLRVASANTALLNAAAALAPEGVFVELFSGLGDLPHFNPDHEEDQTPAVTHWRHSLQSADGVLFSTPEYAHGLPGSLKNALDWVVGSGEMSGKPFTLLHASPMSHHAPAQLIEIVRTMDARFVEAAYLTLPLRGKALDAKGIVADSTFADPLRQAMQAFAEKIRAHAR